MVDEKQVIGEFDVTPVLSAQGLKGVGLGLGAIVVLACVVGLAMESPLGPVTLGLAITLAIGFLLLVFATVHLGLPAYKARGTRFVVDEESIRLFKGQEELGHMRREDIHSIAWSQAPTEWINLSKLELKDQEGVTRLALPIPYQFSPLQKHPGELSCLLYKENQRWQAFVDQTRERVEGREDLQPDFDFSASARRFLTFRRRFTLVAAVGAGLTVYPVVLHAFDLLSKDQFQIGGSSILLASFQLAFLDSFSRQNLGSRKWFTDRIQTWQEQKEKEPGTILPVGRYRYSYPALVKAKFEMLRLANVLAIGATIVLSLGLMTWAVVFWMTHRLVSASLISLALAALATWMSVIEYGSAKHAATMLQNVDDVHEFRVDGTLVVTRATGETLALTTRDRAFLSRKRSCGTYTDGSTDYVVYPAWLDPVPDNRVSEEESTA
jgi:hypothetical protein